MIAERIGRLNFEKFLFILANVNTVIPWEGLSFHLGLSQEGPERGTVAAICQFLSTRDILLLVASFDSVSWFLAGETGTGVFLLQISFEPHCWRTVVSLIKNGSGIVFLKNFNIYVDPIKKSLNMYILDVVYYILKTF